MTIRELKDGEILNKGKSIKEIETLSLKIFEHKTVVGLDIYKYSEYPEVQQMYIPVLFDELYRGTIDNCINAEPFFFSSYGKSLVDFQKNFIPTGDGGFQIFDNPFQAILFSIYFQLHLKRFNSGGDPSYTDDFKLLSQLIDKIELRYAITLDKVYRYKNNIYGQAIINNSRILSRDNLNRLLIDENVLKWMDKNINSIENLSALSKADFSKIEYFKSYNHEENSTLYGQQNTYIKSIDVLKIGNIKVKSTELQVYNLHIQAGLYSGKEGKKRYNYYAVTLGNLNTRGIE